MPTFADVALVKRRQQLLTQLRAVTGTQLSRRWLTLPGYTKDQERQWVAAVTLFVVAAQHRAAGVQVAYLQHLLAVQIAVDFDIVRDTAAIDVTQPFTAFANALDSGLSVAAAIEAGRARAEGVGESSVQWASRAANKAVDDERIIGWTRTVTPRSCEWCRNVAHETYRTADSASFGHLRCDCGVDPVLSDGRDPGRAANNEIFTTA